MQSISDYNFQQAIFTDAHIYASTWLNLLQTQGNGLSDAGVSINNTSEAVQTAQSRLHANTS